MIKTTASLETASFLPAGLPAGPPAAPWFASWFDSTHYHQLYGDRDQREAQAFIDRLVAHLQPEPAARMLDLGCGAGRHATHLASKGFRVTGIDLSLNSIREASQARKPGLRFLRHDMRQPFGRNAFDYVLSFFTSFGYFDDPAENLMVVRNMAASLADGGRVVLDYLNGRHAEACLVSRELKRVKDVAYRLTRWTDAGYFFKRIVIEGGGAPIQHVERVAKISLADFQHLFARCGLTLEEVYGDYDLNPFDSEQSPRLILIARKRPEACAGAQPIPLHCAHEDQAHRSPAVVDRRRGCASARRRPGDRR